MTQHAPPALFHPLDPGRIETMDPFELAYWCKELHCTEEQLRKAVAKAGTHVAAVRQVLEQHKVKG
jgi:hypothetical protein